jgi:glycosyltransferase involved in cell wall biosynthesis
VGTPVLTTTGTPWGFLYDWESGFIVEPDVLSIRAALEQYVSSFAWTKADRHLLAERTRNRFSLSAVGEQYAGMYARVVEEDIVSGNSK